MREPDFRFYGVGGSLLSRNDMSVTVSCRDEHGDCVLGPNGLSIARRTHRIHLSESFPSADGSLSNLRITAYTKLLGARVTPISDWPSTEGLSASTTPSVWEVLKSEFSALSVPLHVVDYLMESEAIGGDENVKIYSTHDSTEPIAAVLRPRMELEAVAAIGKKKNPNRRMLLPSDPPEHPLFVLQSSGYGPEIVVTRSLRDALLARFQDAISFFGKGQAQPT